MTCRMTIECACKITQSYMQEVHQTRELMKKIIDKANMTEMEAKSLHRRRMGYAENNNTVQEGQTEP
jgi:hypothetical protein